MLKEIILCAICLFLAGGIAHAAVIYVPDNYSTIQAAINAASEWDTIIVRQGTYAENIDFLGKTITVMSQYGPGITIIDGNQTGSVVVFQNGENTFSILEGFTISNGSGGILCQNGSSPTITGNTITGNSAAADGGGICCLNNSIPEILNNVISLNSAGSNGGGIYCEDSSPNVINNAIFINTTFARGGGICCFDSSPTISNNTITGNSVTYLGGGGIWCLGSSPTITDTIIYDNNAPFGPEIYVGSSSSPDVTYCDVKGDWAGAGNINADPLFVTGSDGDYYLSQTAAGQGTDSPCVDVGSDLASNLGMDSQTTRTDQTVDSAYVDMGFHYESHIGPDLEITSLLFTPAALDPNSLITVSYTIENKGNKPCGSISAIAFFLSFNENIYLNDIWLGEDSVPDLNPGESYTKTDIPVDVGDKPGNWFFGGYADWTELIAELDENNGRTAGPITINSLWADAETLSQQNGGTVQFDLKPGIDYERRCYFLLGSMTGTAPGTILPGGGVLPLNRDAFFNTILQWFNNPTFSNFRAYLDTSGEATASLNVLPGEIPVHFVGRFFDFAFTTESPFDFQSNAVTVEVVQ